MSCGLTLPENCPKSNILKTGKKGLAVRGF